MLKCLTVVAVLATPAVALASDYIQQVETKLAAQGYSPGPIDGEFDDALTQAIRQFQTAHDLPASGMLSRETYDAIMTGKMSKAAPAPVMEVAPMDAAPMEPPSMSAPVEADMSTPVPVAPEPVDAPAAQYEPAPRPQAKVIFLGESQARELRSRHQRVAAPVEAEPPVEPVEEPMPEEESHQIVP
jgi:peptidoglycan hydrolase-like protein with peptidoglycan-binding domain